MSESSAFLFFSGDAREVVTVQDILSTHRVRGHAWILRSDAQLTAAPACDVVAFAMPPQLDTILKWLERWQATQSAPALVLANEFTEQDAFQLLTGGVRGLATYAEFSSHAKAALGVLMRGGFWIPRAIMTAYFDSALGAMRRSRQALEQVDVEEFDTGLVQGLLDRCSDEQLAEQTGATVATVRSDVTRLLDALGVRRRDDLLLLAQSPPPTVRAKSRPAKNGTRVAGAAAGERPARKRTPSTTVGPQ
jgi:DNA-binding NarL/FixJ family response regulator